MALRTKALVQARKTGTATAQVLATVPTGFTWLIKEISFDLVIAGGVSGTFGLYVEHSGFDTWVYKDTSAANVHRITSRFLVIPEGKVIRLVSPVGSTNDVVLSGAQLAGVVA